MNTLTWWSSRWPSMLSCRQWMQLRLNKEKLKSSQSRDSLQRRQELSELHSNSKCSNTASSGTTTASNGLGTTSRTHITISSGRTKISSGRTNRGSKCSKQRKSSSKEWSKEWTKQRLAWWRSLVAINEQHSSFQERLLTQKSRRKIRQNLTVSKISEHFAVTKIT